MDENTNELLLSVIAELRNMRARAARSENRMHCRILDAEADADELLHHEWLLGRFSGISEALACVESFVEREAN